MAGNSQWHFEGGRPFDEGANIHSHFTIEPIKNNFTPAMTPLINILPISSTPHQLLHDMKVASLSQ